MSNKGRTGATPPDLTQVRAYGDTLNDGQVQLSLSLPVPLGEEGREAARQLVAQMGLQEPQVYHAADLGEGYSFYILYARSPYSVDYTQIQIPTLSNRVMERDEIEELIQQQLNRKITILGACTGTDAHTTGIDAIINMKGIHGERGLESYRGFNALNLGAQVSNERLIVEARKHEADVLLVSQVVTQKDIHRTNLTELIDILEAESLRSELIVIAGGPRISHELALELGYDAGFGPGTTAKEVASFIVQVMTDHA